MSMAITFLIALICLRGFLSGRTPPLYAQEDIPMYHAPYTNPYDGTQDVVIVDHTKEISKLRERVAKQNDKIADLDTKVAQMQGKLDAQNSFWSFQNGGVGVGVLALLGFQGNSFVKSRRRGGHNSDLPSLNG